MNPGKSGKLSLCSYFLNSRVGSFSYFFFDKPPSFTFDYCKRTIPKQQPYTHTHARTHAHTHTHTHTHISIILPLLDLVRLPSLFSPYNQGGDYFPKFFRNLTQVVQIYCWVETFGKIVICTSQCTYSFCKCQKIKMADIQAKRPQGQKSKFQKPNKLYTIRSRNLC